MKKLLTIMIIAIAGCISINQVMAQTRSSRSRLVIKKERKPIHIDWYLKAGGGAMSMTAEDIYDYNAGNKMNIGYNLAGGFQWQIGKGPIYWGMQLGSSMIRGRYDYMSDDPEPIINHSAYLAVKQNCYTAFIGPQLGFKKSLSKSVALDCHVGPNFEMAFLKSGSQTWWSYDNDYQMWGFAGDKDSPMEYYDAMWVDVDAGVGLWFGRILVELEYRHGFNVSGANYVQDSNNYMLNIGYKF